jgi:alcohol dehydrogenase
MLALQIGDDAAIGLIDAAEPPLVEPTDVLVRVTTTTICGGDVHLRHGVIPVEPNFISGHEYVGVVEEIGEAVRTLVPGDRVVGAAIVSCGVCDRCRVGAPQGCRSGGILGAGPSWGGFGGSHAERLRVPFADRTAAKVPDSLEDEQVLLVGDVLATGFHGARSAAVAPGDVVAVLGAGPVGLCAVHCLSLFGASRVVAIEPEEARRKMALTLGADAALAPGEDPAAAVLAATDGREPDVVIECAGHPATLRAAVELVRPGGRIAVIGNPGGHEALPLIDLFNKAVTYSGGLARLDCLSELVALIDAGRLDLRPMITHRFALADIVDGFELFEARDDGVIKVGVSVGGTAA